MQYTVGRRSRERPFTSFYLPVFPLDSHRTRRFLGTTCTCDLPNDLEPCARRVIGTVVSLSRCRTTCQSFSAAVSALLCVRLMYCSNGPMDQDHTPCTAGHVFNSLVTVSGVY